jgi:hypothetical protein
MAADELTEIGSSGLRRTGGMVIDDRLPALRGLTATNAWREMSDNDPVVGAVLFAIEKLLLKVEWRVDPYSDPGEQPTETDQDVAAFVESCRHDMSDSWDSFLSGVLTMLPFGWSFHEIVYKRRVGPDQDDPARRSKLNDGKIGWRKLAYRSQETRWQWQFDEHGGIQALVQMDPSLGTRVVIPIEKGLLFRTTTAKGNPEGRSVLRNAFRPWYYKRRIEEIEAVGVERDLAGLPVAYVPPEYLSGTASPAQQQVLTSITQIVQNVKRNEQEGIVFPLVYNEHGHKMFEFQLLSSGGKREFNTDAIIARYDQRIAMSVLADFILLGHENVGSFALGSSKVDLFTTAIEAWVKAIAEVFNAHAIPRLLKLNGMDVARCPELTYGDIGAIDLPGMADFVQKLTSAGALMPDEPLEDWLRELAGLPPADHDDDMPDLAPPPSIVPEPDDEDDSEDDSDDEDDGVDDDGVLAAPDGA